MVVTKKQSPEAAKAAGKTPEFKKSGRARNYDLGNGVLRFSRAKMFHKKALYKFVGKKVAAAKKTVQPRVVEKKIGGDKNGGKRFVLVNQRRKAYPTIDNIRVAPSKKTFSQHKRSIRSTLTPGTVLILLAGAHKGKRVVLLKQLNSGLLMVTGPFQINGCPLRRISQRYVIGTQTKIDVSGVKIPENLDDEYFRRQNLKKLRKKGEGDIFKSKRPTYKVSDDKKQQQKDMDKQVFEAIRKHPDRKVLLAYLSAMWGLRSSQFPHRLQF
ncbi:unnamed protein product [Brassicogethes aeneus]|uniref:Large ribosomal subunit protein eL6 n=1 Tax=Brassicogethes aeneus TaxID=1431903 RepID=A0A9P0FCW2_BRAAE|nr:unnamed protein product [Brassicogethes aeneus]